MGCYKQLNFKERSKIEVLINRNMSLGKIAQELKRSKSTICRELKRNSIDGLYMAVKAQSDSRKRKHRKPYKLKVNSTVYKYVLQKLNQGWSPEQISGRLRLSKSKINICAETIYQYLYKHAVKSLYKLLPQQRARRRARGKRKSRIPNIEQRCINNRPKYINDRSICGHWEGDTIRFGDNKKRSVTTLVERKSRLVKLLFNERSTSSIVMKEIGVLTQLCKPQSWKSITFDQGSEFQFVYEIEKYKFCDIYFANAHSPWQRGTNENTNKRLRRYLPKKFNTSHITHNLLREIEKKMNSTPRKCLDFKTPYEVFYRS